MMLYDGLYLSTVIMGSVPGVDVLVLPEDRGELPVFLDPHTPEVVDQVRRLVEGMRIPPVSSVRTYPMGVLPVYEVHRS
jgi:hypothetical protein